MENCIFCKILGGKIPSSKVWEDENFIAIRDIQPQAKAHLLVIPRRHFECVDSAGAESVVAGLLSAANAVASSQGLAQDGFRFVINTRQFGGQTVGHLHLHVLGGQQLHGSFA